ncbi:MAG: N-formylglutamate amidohydrolase [Alphaproteobacteria bacterium]|nr:N-formylglutamate amidohydrolase [Alphaproteobacteria bacterium]
MNDTERSAPSALLGPADPPAWRAVNGCGRAPVLLLCDHASNRVPVSLGDLGLTKADLARHIGWDIGAAAVTERLAALLDAPALLSGYSRLVLDCNRHPGTQGLCPTLSDGVAVPGNQGLSEADIAARTAALFEPYQRAIADRIARFAAAGVVPALVSLHSFTPVWAGVARPWHVGVLWDRDPRIPVPLLAALRADPRLTVGDNEPYSAREPHGYTVDVHGTRRGLPHVLIEIRQDLVADDAGAAAWADRLASALKPILADPKLYAVEHH